jgi:hypothetical protein
MALQTANQYRLTPDVLGARRIGLQHRQAAQEEANKEALRVQAAEGLAARQAALGVPSEVPEGGESREAATQRMIAMDPDKASKVLETIGVVSTSQKEDAAAFADNVLAAPIEARTDLINARVRALTAEGRDATHTMMLLEQSPEQLEASMQGLKVNALTALQRQTAQTARERLEADKAKAATGPGADTVQSSKILPGGLVQLVYKSGKLETLPPDEANAEMIRSAELWGAKLQGLRAGERGAATEGTKAAAAAFKGLAAARKNINNMNEGIRLLQGGAKTGAIESMLPSVRAASVKLDNLRNRLGLDVIGGTTFGALSESELNFALHTALPTGLDEVELLQWMTEKRDAQMKVAANLEEAALFLGEPGNTVADFIKMKKAARPQLPEGVTEEDIEVTMRENGMTRAQVLERLGVQ